MEKIVIKRLEAIGGKKPWIAKILGRDPKYKFERNFLAGFRDSSGSNSVGSRGIFYEFEIQDDGIYELKFKRSWKGEKHIFIRIKNGEEEEITLSDVLKEVI